MNVDQLKFNQAIKGFQENFPLKPTDLFIAPGRVEIVGNHTDHQHGQTLSMTIDRYIYAAVSKNDDFKVVSYNRGYPVAIDIDLNDLSVKESEYSTSVGLIRGVFAYFHQHGYRIGGFNCFSISTILRGMGLSSSAAFEVLVAKIINHYYNDNQISDLEIAKASQFAEQVYFHKPCGLLDQMTISYGGVVLSDFNQLSPVQAHLDKMDNDLHFYVINTGKSHAKLTPHYAQITDDLRRVSAAFGQKLLIDVDYKQFKHQYEMLKHQLGERALKRAVHIFEENIRVEKAWDSLNKGQIEDFITQIRASGLSSRNYLQNLTYHGDKDRSLINAYDKLYKKTPFGVRVNGGGFAGTLIVMTNHQEDEAVISKVLNNPKMKILPVKIAKYKSGHVSALD